MSFKLGEEVYILNGITGKIMKTNYGGKCWQEELGLISRDLNDLRRRIASVRSHVYIKRQQRGGIMDYPEFYERFILEFHAFNALLAAHFMIEHSNDAQTFKKIVDATSWEESEN